jgi:hypothetical protein
MNSFELDIDEKSRIASAFMARVANEIRRAASIEKASRKITQQAIAEKIGTSRAVVNREMNGLENLTARRTAELLWALGWEPYFEARKVPEGDNQFDNRTASHPAVVVVPMEYNKAPPAPKILEPATSAVSSNSKQGTLSSGAR